MSTLIGIFKKPSKHLKRLEYLTSLTPFDGKKVNKNGCHKFFKVHFM